MNPAVMGFIAEGGSTVSSALQTGLGTVASDAMGAIAAIVPIALPVLGAGIVIRMGIKYFKLTAKNG